MSTINTRLGRIEGLDRRGVQIYRGVRFAEPPVRFQPAVQSGAWEGTYDATHFPNRAWQPPGQGFLEREKENGELDEDCLFLSIYTPGADGARRPVLFWIHGGSHTFGSGNDYDGTALAERGDVVVVSVNYRLGFFGFADLSFAGPEYAASAANGIGDHIVALQWARDNIADFGGDPDNVTIFGESAGGSSVLALLASPGADGLYHKAIAHSPAAPSSAPVPMGPLLAAHLDITEDEVMGRLLEMDPPALVALKDAVGVGGGACVDGLVMTRSTLDAIAERGAAGVPLIAGSNRDEGTLFTLLMGDDPAVLEPVEPVIAGSLLEGRDPTDYLSALAATYPDDTVKRRFERVWADLFRRPCLHAAAAATAAGPGGWLYRFDYPAAAADGTLGATHGVEVAFTFNSFAHPEENKALFNDLEDKTAAALAQKWSDSVIAFARTGEPNGAGLPTWPRYSTDDRRSIVLDADCRVEADLDATHRKLWGDA